MQGKNGSWCLDRESLSTLLDEHFKNISTTSNPDQNEDFFNHVQYVITSQENDRLLVIPTEAEILGTLKSMDPWKAPGLDGFPPVFI